jgi:hypothetical protein
MHASVPRTPFGRRVLAAQGRALPLWATGIALAIALVGVIWLPFGFSMGAIVEEWDMRYLFDSGRMGWTAFPGQPMSDLFAARPLTPVPFVLAHLLAPESFAGFHVVLILALALRVFAGFGIGWWLFRDRFLAVCVGALALVIPADTQQIALRNIHINLAVALMLVACLASLHAFFCTTARRRGLHLTIAFACGVAGCGIYEPVFPLYALTPLLLFGRLGLRRTWSLVLRRRIATAAWLVGVTASGAYLWFAIAVQKSAYQVSLAGGASGGIVRSILANADALFESAGYRFFYDAWRMAWHVAVNQTLHPAMLAGVFLVIFAVLNSRQVHGRNRAQKPALLIRAFIAGVAGLALGYAPVLASVSHIAVSQRTFIAATPGAAIALTVLLACQGMVSRTAAIAMASVALSLGLFAQLFQHDMYVRSYVDVSSPYLQEVARRSDPRKRIHLVIDETGLGGNLGGIYVTKLRYGVPVLRSALDDTYYLCREQPAEATMPFMNCRLKEDSWVVTGFDGRSDEWRASEVDLVHMPREHVDRWISAARVDSRFPSLFVPPRHPTDRFDCSADSMWGYSRFCAGEGWSDGATVRRDLERSAAFYAAVPQPRLFASLVPVEAPYVLRIEFAHPLPRVLQNEWGVEVNGVGVPMMAESGILYEGTVNFSLLREGTNVLTVRNARSQSGGHAIGVRRVVLEPQGRPRPADLQAAPTLKPGVAYKASDRELVAAMVRGFSVPELNGIWTDGEQSILRFTTPSKSGGAALALTVMPFLNERHPSMQVDAMVGSNVVASFDFRSPGAVSARVPLAAEQLRLGGAIEVRLLIRDPATPADVGAGDRFLGLFVQQARIEP